jgi:poly(A) polymerase
MDERVPFRQALPPAARDAVDVVRKLRGAGFEALLAGGCVRDLLRGAAPEDYDVATSARPEQVCALLKPTRQVGAQFGVVLARQRRTWIEVATFRADLGYADGRHPTGVRFTDAREDALRRDFTVNGMFLDPLEQVVLDYVGGRADLEQRLVRAIGDPAARFDEDHLRLLRAVRFAARLDFTIEPVTRAAIRDQAPRLARVAAERVREELEKMLAHPARGAAFRDLEQTGLLAHLWPGAVWTEAQRRRAAALLTHLPPAAGFAAAFAALANGRDVAELERIGRALTFSNEQREDVLWVAAHGADLADPAQPSRAALKRLLAHRAFAALRDVSEAAWRADCPDADARSRALAERIAAIAPDQIAPAPLVTGADLLARNVPAGPIYKQVLDELYTRQLDEELTTRAAALAALDARLRDVC